MPKLFSKKLASKQNRLLVVLLVIASILIVLVLIEMFKIPNSSIVITDSNDGSNDSGENMMIDYDQLVAINKSDRDIFREDVPVGIVVPEKDSPINEEEKKEIALPQIVIPSSPSSDSKFRSFTITAENNNFSPLKIIANVGDTVHVKFTAVDKDYNIVFPSYNKMQSAEKGQTKAMQFKAIKDGNFTYYCSVCGGPEQGPKGNIIIVP